MIYQFLKIVLKNMFLKILNLHLKKLKVLESQHIDYQMLHIIKISLKETLI